MKARWWWWMLVVTLAAAPRPTAAQCMGMGGGGGHDHGRETASRKDETKTRRSIERVLATEEGRRLLLEVVLADTGFMRDLVSRIAEAPEWRALAAERLAAPPSGTVAAPGDSAVRARKSPAPPAAAALYRCPMHPEVTAREPGDCPKCGMALERAE